MELWLFYCNKETDPGIVYLMVISSYCQTFVLISYAKVKILQEVLCKLIHTFYICKYIYTLSINL